MDNAVGLVQAYLHVNGHFTVTEHPVLEALEHGGVQSATDIDVVALRLPQAGGLVTIGSHQREAFVPYPALARVLPGEFLQLGMATHQAFDTLAATASAGAGPAVARLARIASRCVACHATYRLEAQ